MTTKLNQTKSDDKQTTNPSSEDILNLWENLPAGTFTVGGIIYPRSQFAEVLPYWFQDKPLPPSKWQSKCAR